jgi:Hemopexin
MIDYFFSGREYIRVTREDTGPGTVDAGYPAPISNWGWPGGFGANGIDAALYSGSKCYFFSGSKYVRVTRGTTGAGAVDPGYPAPISNWGWPDGFGANGIDAALWSGTKCYFFSGSQYIRVTRGDTGAGTVDPGYPKLISAVWGWPGGFGANGIDGALYSGSRCYFFSGGEYIRVRRGEEGQGLVDAGYPKSIATNWGWPNGFGANGINTALYSGGPLVPPPANGPVSNVNYFLDGGGQALTGVTATVDFDSDFNSSANGYSLQLNCYSTEGPKVTTEWQQYVIRAGAGGSEVFAMIDTWSGTQLTDELNRIQVPLASLPSPTIPAGYTFTIVLTYDGNHNVTGAVYTVLDQDGKTAGSTTLTIVGQTLRTTGKPATAANLAPIAALQFDIGGVGGGAQATLTEGVGTVTYAAAQTLTVVNAEPAFTDFDDGTAESANLAFGPLPAAPSPEVSQGFVTTAPPATVRRLLPGRRTLPPL